MTQSTAQVHPRHFTAAMMRAAEAKGAELRLGRVTGVVCGRSCAGVKGVQVDGEIIGGDAAVIAMAHGRSLPRDGCRCPACSD
jgi:glycine/D-amino acid oxidase-like deaminating enzyme